MSEVRDSLAASISEAVKDEGDLVIKWVALIEVLDENGERCVWTIGNEGATSWDILGLLHHALSLQQVNYYIPVGEDDE